MSARSVWALVLLVSVIGMPLHAGAETSTSTDETEDVRVHNAAEVEKAVRTAFDDAPVMAEIARCESKFRQYTDSGNVLRGGYGGGYLGVFQFSEQYHASAARKLGFDLETLDGNIGYAKHIYEISGTDPWISSFGCWNKADTDADSDGDSDTSAKTSSKLLGADLSFGQTHSEVLTLQRLLNKAGFTVADSGPGSEGNETTMFGNLTRAAIRKFQCEEMDICSGDEYSTGYGFVNAKTRSALLAYDGKGKAKESAKKTAATKSSQTAKTTKASVKTSDAALQAQLETQIAELLKLVAELQKQIALLVQASVRS